MIFSLLIFGLLLHICTGPPTHVCAHEQEDYQGFSPSALERQGSSVSDLGLFTLRASGKDAYIYFVDEGRATVRLHIVLSIPTCYCIGSADIRKMNQIDYLATLHYCYSFSIYVNDGMFQDRRRCMLNTAQMQARTELAFNELGSPAIPEIGGHPKQQRRLMQMSDSPNATASDEERRQSPSPSAELVNIPPLHPPTVPPDWDPSSYKIDRLERVEAAALAMSIRDFLEHSYVSRHMGEVFGNDNVGGFLFMQGTVMIRQCRLQWYLPFIFSPGGDARLIPYTLPYDERAMGDVDYYTKEDAVLLNNILGKMVAAGIVTDAHLGNLGRNNRATFNVRAFAFSSVFVPYRHSREFLALLEPFAYTTLSPWVTVPLVMQMMFAPGDWVHLNLQDNETIMQGYGVLTHCMADTVEDTTTYTNVDAARDLFYYSYSYCGGGLVDKEYVIERAKSMITFYWARVVLGLFLAIVVCMVLAVLRRHMSGKTVKRYINWLTCGRVGGYKKLHQDGDREDDEKVPMVKLDEPDNTRQTSEKEEASLDV